MKWPKQSADIVRELTRREEKIGTNSFSCMIRFRHPRPALGGDADSSTRDLWDPQSGPLCAARARHQPRRTLADVSQTGPHHCRIAAYNKDG